MDGIRVVDISSLLHGSQNENESLVDEIRSALGNVGAFYIKGHGIPVETLNAVLQQARDFFSLPLDKKNALSFKDSKAFRGYLHKGAEATAGKIDVKEGFFVGTTEGQGANHEMLGENRYPDDLPLFKNNVESFMPLLSELGMMLAKMFARGLGLKDDYLHKMFNPPFYNMALWHYPPNAENDDSWGIGPHTDYEAFTFLLQDNVGGLELKMRDGSWVDIPPIEGTLVAMIGDVTECWTKGLYRAPVHRVRNAASLSRYSAAFFFQPNLSTMVKPLDVPFIVEREYQPTRQDLKIPFNYGNQLKENYSKYFQ